MGAKAPRSVVVVYEDSAARERAVDFCDQLAARFRERCKFDVSWWSFELLAELGSASQAAQRAAEAEVVVVAAAPEGDFAPSVKEWLDRWLAQRAKREGMLAGLLEAEPSPGNLEGPKAQQLRQAAHRGEVVYVTQVPQETRHTMPDSLDSYSSRADHVTSLLQDILRQPPPPPPTLP